MTLTYNKLQLQLNDECYVIQGSVRGEYGTISSVNYEYGLCDVKEKNSRLLLDSWDGAILKDVYPIETIKANIKRRVLIQLL